MTDSFGSNHGILILLMLITLVLLLVNFVKAHKNAVEMRKERRTFKVKLDEAEQALNNQVDRNQKQFKDMVKANASVYDLIETNKSLELDVDQHKAFSEKYIVDIHGYYGKFFQSVDRVARKTEVLENNIKNLQEQMASFTEQQNGVATAINELSTGLSSMNTAQTEATKVPKLKRGLWLKRKA